MARAAMTVDTLDSISRGLASLNDVMNEVSVTAQATVLKYRCVAGMNHDWLVKVLQCKALGMPVAIVRFRNVFGNEFMRQVTIDASRGSVMRALQPRGVLVVHDVTVRACTRVGREITQALTVVEREQPDTGDKPDQTGQQHAVG
jgi:hypothetical protein